MTMAIDKNTVPSKGRKFDKEKVRLDLVPPEAILALGAVMTHGAEKYGANNWLKGMDWGRLYAAAQRHLQAWAMREELDLDSGMPHLWHALTDIAFLITYKEQLIGTDNRRRIDTNGAYGEKSTALKFLGGEPVDVDALRKLGRTEDENVLDIDTDSVVVRMQRKPADAI